MELDLVSLLVLLLATYRLSILIASDAEGGPWNILNKLRRGVGMRYDRTSSRPYGVTMLASGMLCIYCNSVWIGLVWTLLYLVFGSLTVWLALPLALSGAAVLLSERAVAS